MHQNGNVIKFVTNHGWGRGELSLPPQATFSVCISATPCTHTEQTPYYQSTSFHHYLSKTKGAWIQIHSSPVHTASQRQDEEVGWNNAD